MVWGCCDWIGNGMRWLGLDEDWGGFDQQARCEKELGLIRVVCTATHYNTLQRAATHCTTLQHAENVLWRTS